MKEIPTRNRPHLEYELAAAARAPASFTHIATPRCPHLDSAGHAQRCITGDAGDLLEQFRT